MEVLPLVAISKLPCELLRAILSKDTCSAQLPPNSLVRFWSSLAGLKFVAALLVATNLGSSFPNRVTFTRRTYWNAREAELQRIINGDRPRGCMVVCFYGNFPLDALFTK